MLPDPVVHLVDDDEAVRHSLAFLLTSAGFAVRTYDSAAAFLDALEAVRPGCVVTDVRMPGLSGLALQRELISRRIGLPVIVMTGHGDVKLAVEAMKAGAVDFIEKPFQDEVMLTAIRAAFDRYARDTRHHDEANAVEARLHTLTMREREVLDRRAYAGRCQQRGRGAGLFARHQPAGGVFWSRRAGRAGAGGGG